MQSELKRLVPILFPGGHDEIVNKGRSISALLDSRIPPESASKLYTSTKYLLHTSADKSRERMISYLHRQAMGLISDDDAAAIYDRFIAISPQTLVSGTASTSLTKTEAPKTSSFAVQAASLGSVERPIVIEAPAHIGELRKKFKDKLNGTPHAHLAKAEEAIDSMIAEGTKMSRLDELLGEEGKAWKCGERNYLAGAIQSQQIIFFDGRPVVLVYFDFSRFGGSLDWGRKI